MPLLKVSRKGKRYGAHLTGLRVDDAGFPAYLLNKFTTPPPSFFVPGQLGDVKDQADSGMCTGEASCAEGERLYRFRRNQSPDFAPEFTYALEREFEGTWAQGDVGAQVITSLIVPDPANNKPFCVGWCPTNVSGYVPLDIGTLPSQAQLAAAAKWQGGARHWIGNNIMNMKWCILSGYTFVIGIYVYSSFESDETANSGLIPFPNLNSSNEQLQGGHEMHAGIGYDDTIQCPNAANPGAIMVQNSWGQNWGIKSPQSGQRGFAWIPYDYVMSSQLTTDVRMSHLGKAWVAPTAPKKKAA